MSRIIIKGLPDKILKEELSNYFGDYGVITDCSLRYTQSGKFRRFAFIGYQTKEQAENAVKHLHSSFIQTFKISVEICANLGEKSKPRAWSKYSGDSSAYQKMLKKFQGSNMKEGEAEATLSTDKAKSNKNSLKNLVGDALSDEQDFQDFLELHDKSGRLKKMNAEGTSKDDCPPQKPDDEGILYSNDNMPKLEVEMNRKQRHRLKRKLQKQQQMEKFLHSTSHKIQMFGLPQNAHKEDIIRFFKPLKIVHMARKKAGHGQRVATTVVGFEDDQTTSEAFKRNKNYIGEKKIFLKLVNNEAPKPDQPENLAQWHHKLEERKKLGKEVAEETIAENGRLFLRNLPYQCTEDQLSEIFSKFGPTTEVSLLIDKTTKNGIGLGFVTFLFPEHAVKAYTSLDGTVFQGRMLHILPSEPAKEVKVNAKLFKDQKKVEEKQKSGSSHNWNTLFLGANAVADAMANKFMAEKSHILDTNSKGSLAVKMALGETQIVLETRQFLIKQGVCLDSFSQADAPRSGDCILVKNLPVSANLDDLWTLLSGSGTIKRLVVPPSGVTGLVQYSTPIEARAAFEKLAYYKFDHVPLYLEWAPMGVFAEAAEDHDSDEGNAADERKDNKNSKAKEGEEEEDEGEEDDEGEESNYEGCTIFVKNLNFDTTEEDLRKKFICAGKLRSVTIATKKHPKISNKLLSMGYGFVQFTRPASAKEALKKLQKCELDGHRLELKLSERQQREAVNRRKKQDPKKVQIGTKILIRNIPFEASATEVEELFSVFGSLKFIRLPKKMGSSQHRGFGFADFHTKQEAKRAFNALCHSTHVLGRRLVLEWAQHGESVDELRKRSARQLVAARDVKYKKQKKSDFVDHLMATSPE